MGIERIIITTVLILALIIISTTTAAALSCGDGDICANETGWWRDSGAFNASGTPIQAAVDNATASEKICVAAGNYTENVDIATAHLTLAGEGADVVTVTAANPSNHVFNVATDYVNITGFNVTGATIGGKVGVRLDGADHCNISDNIVSNNYDGIYLRDSSDNTLTSNTANLNQVYGIFLRSSSNNRLTNNTANSNHGYGIFLGSSSNHNTLTSNTADTNNNHGINLVDSSNYNTLTSNTANSNGEYGIHLHSSSDNTLAGNKMSGNTYNFGFDVHSFSLSEYTQNIDTSNTVDGKPIYYWVDQKDRQIPSDAGFVGVVNGTNITVRDLTLTNNGQGVLFVYTENSRIENVTVSNNGYGILLVYSSNNTLASNTANSNNRYGIYLIYSSDNTLTNNTANSNNYYGIYLIYSSNHNTLTNNIALNNNIGIRLVYSSNNTLNNNIALNNEDGISLSSSSNNTLNNNNASNNIGNFGIFLIGSSNNTLNNNTANSNSKYGIRLTVSSNNTLNNNTANSNSEYGIMVYYSCSNNTLTSNTASSNNNYGIYLYGLSNNNLIYNNYFNNTNNAYEDGSNQWNITKTSGTNIIGGPYLGGNYWSDYAGVDNDGDGLGDTILPYNSSSNIQNSGDYHPLVPCADATPPVITITTPVPYELYIMGMTLDFSATDDESGVATIVGNLTNTSEVSQIVDSGFALEVGVYTLVVTATDNAGNTNESNPVFFVVYDPDGGFATGGGWFYPDSDSTLPDGRANFGFTAKYKDDRSTGKLNFQYKDADIHLKSTSIDWLTISSVSAQFQGTGTINGEGLYTFWVKAKDNGEPGVYVDHFDIKIWDDTDTEADPIHKAKNIISGGNIQVHTK